MNDQNPPPVPPTPPAHNPHKPNRVEPKKVDFAAMAGSVSPLALFDHLLKKPECIVHELGDARRGETLFGLLLLCIVCLGAYGAIVGLFSGGTQYWAAPAKIIGGGLFSALLCAPSLYIFLSLDRRNTSIAQTAGTLLSVLGLASVLLIGFAPVAWIFAVSTESLRLMGFFHLLFWFIGVLFGVKVLQLDQGQGVRRKSGYLTVWALIFTLVTLQMTTTLRPLLGTSDTLLPTEKRFFVEHWTSDFDQDPATGKE